MSLDPTYLDGTEWVLRTKVSRANESGIALTHEAVIHATSETRAKWNAHFWRLFPEPPGEFNEAVLNGHVAVAVMFRFRPTAHLKESYDGHPVLKVARIVEGSRGRIDLLPPHIAGAVSDYQRDRRRLDEQRRKAWLELLHTRLPTPPFGYTWELVSSDPRSYSDLLQFRLKPR